MSAPDLRERARSERAELRAQGAILLDRIAIKTVLPLGVEVDVDFLEHVALYIHAVDEHLRLGSLLELDGEVDEPGADKRDTDRPPPAAAADETIELDRDAVRALRSLEGE
jgi:hypothetical protein